MTAAVYTANDIVFYLAGQGFTYGEGSEADEHMQAEADAHTVVHITQPGTYRLSGRLSAGQIATFFINPLIFSLPLLYNFYIL